MTEEKPKVLIVDDEPGVRDSLKLLLKSNYDVTTAEDGSQALTVVQSLNPDLVLLDLIMPKVDGLETLRQLKDQKPDVPVIILTGTNTVKTAVQAMKYGAVDYLSKPFDVEELKNLIAMSIERTSGVRQIVENQPVRANIPRVEGDYGVIVGQSGPMLELYQKMKQVAERDTTVLITGESGTGKELVARQIHLASPRKNGPFIPINCAAIPESLIESELFGHEKGAFTNAIERRIGHFEQADKGTLFLDEIGELSLQVQVKILRFLQEQEFYRIGRSKPIRVDVRVIAATNRNLEQAIKEKKFREDLYYRINVIGLHLPALRDRFEDIPRLVESFFLRFAPVYGGRKMNFCKGALDVLVEYPWPGNVRELENVVESIMALCPNDEVLEADLPDKLRMKGGIETLKLEPSPGQIGFEEAERRFETEIILKALRKTNYVQTRAAELLGISRRILKYKMDKLGISDAAPDTQN